MLFILSLFARLGENLHPAFKDSITGIDSEIYDSAATLIIFTTLLLVTLIAATVLINVANGMSS